MKPIVFLGPSLSLTDAQQLIDADFFPPCKMSDIYRAVKRRPSAIVIIDGLFERQPAVWHKEILYALSEKIPVVGASSMGALRAAELSAFGMTGIGSIFHQFASAELNDDDEVAVVHGSKQDNYFCISEAMVNIRYGLTLATEADVITAAQADYLISRSKARYYPTRCWESVFRDCETLEDSIDSDGFRQFIAQTDTNLKARDAKEALVRVARGEFDIDSFSVPDFTFEKTCYWKELVELYGNDGLDSESETGMDTRQLASHVRIFAHDKTTLLEKAYVLSEAGKMLREGNIIISDNELPDLMARFRRNRQLHSPQQLTQWMADNHLSRQQLISLIKLDAATERLILSMTKPVDQQIVNSLVLNGRYQSIQSDSMQDSQNDLPHFDQDRGHSEAFYAELLTWYQNHYQIIDGNIEDFVRRLGIANENMFINELIKQYRQEVKHDV